MDFVNDSLITTFRETTSLVPLQTYWGSEPFVDSGCVKEKEQCSKEECQGKSHAWSRGLGYEISPIKTRSACKKLGHQPTSSDRSFSTNLDLGALRGMKSLAREKS